MTKSNVIHLIQTEYKEDYIEKLEEWISVIKNNHVKINSKQYEDLLNFKVEFLQETINYMLIEKYEEQFNEQA